MKLLWDRSLRCVIPVFVFLLCVEGAQGGGRVPTAYNQRYQALYAEQELFRKRPELLGCVHAARDFAQSSQTAIFNKLRFTSSSVQTGFVSEALSSSRVSRTVRMQGEGRVRAYSFLENWEPANITCTFFSGDSPLVQLSVLEEGSPKDDLSVTKE